MQNILIYRLMTADHGSSSGMKNDFYKGKKRKIEVTVPLDLTTSYWETGIDARFHFRQ